MLELGLMNSGEKRIGVSEIDSPEGKFSKDTKWNKVDIVTGFTGGSLSPDALKGGSLSPEAHSPLSVK